ncbi:MAG: hypothetical protein LDL22_04015, partial [Hyphomicrobiales bacterium]|nr:hypothetical protein [Hyphomicrobiales bacterium]
QAERAREAHQEEARRAALLRQDLQARQAELREFERRLGGLDTGAALARFRGGEETYRSEIPAPATAGPAETVHPARLSDTRASADRA